MFIDSIQCLPAAFFTLAGAYQMTMWALGKHRYQRSIAFEPVTPNQTKPTY